MFTLLKWLVHPKISIMSLISRVHVNGGTESSQKNEGLTGLELHEHE